MKNVNCIECNKEFNVSDKANQYNMDVEDKIYRCPYCGQLNYQSETKEKMLFRAKIVNGDKLVEGTAIFKDPVNTWISYHDETLPLAYGMQNHLVDPDTIVRIEDIKHNDELPKELEELVKPLQEWLFKNYHPHAKVIVDSTTAELVEGQMCVHNKDIENRG